jgi:large subunit ribosomal protein L3
VSIELICRKLGMTQIFDENGDSVPVTVLRAGPNTVVQVKREGGPDRYAALQLGFGQRREKLFTKPQRGHFARAGVPPMAQLAESRIPDAEAAGYSVGQQLKVDLFSVGQRVDAIGTSKGRGFAGVVKRHNFPIKRRTHGTHEYFRHPGSIGARSYPGKVWAGKRHAGHMGDERVTVQNLEVVRVDAERDLLFVRGAVPGHRDGIVRIRPAVAPKRAPEPEK